MSYNKENFIVFMPINNKISIGFKARPIATAVALASALMIAGCSSSGGTTGSERLPDGPTSPGGGGTSPIEADGKVLVGLVDSGFRDTHESFQPDEVDEDEIAEGEEGEEAEEKILYKTNVADGTRNLTSHAGDGTKNASYLLQSNDGNNALMLAQVGHDDVDEGQLGAATLFGIKALADRGAQVIQVNNVAFETLLTSSGGFRGVDAHDAINSILVSNQGKGSVLVLPAGDDNQAYNELLDLGGLPDGVLDNLIVAGSNSTHQIEFTEYFSREDADPEEVSESFEFHLYSNHPGSSQDIMSRFLMAPGAYEEMDLATHHSNTSSEIGNFNDPESTTVSATILSNYVAVILDRWPHLSAKEVTDRLINTADRTHEYYGMTQLEIVSEDDDGQPDVRVIHECGGEDINCGEYFFGQGVADIDAAWAPHGELSMPTGNHIDDGSISATASYMTLSSAYGSVDSSALSGIAVFDELGRDYQFDLSSGIAQSDNYNRTQIDRMTRISESGQGVTATNRFDGNSFSFMQSFRGNGDIMASRFDAKLPAMTLTGFQFRGSEMNPMDIRSESGFMPMMSWQGGSAMTQNLNDTRGVAMERSFFHPNLSMGISHWSGRSDAESSDYSAKRSEISMGWSVTPSLAFELGTSISTEDNGLLGATGSGELSFGDSNDLQTYSTSLSYQFSPALSGFATYELGKGNVDGSGMVRGINNLRTSEMSLGIQWKADKHHLGFAFSQPAYIESGVMSLNVPVGRDAEGNILRENREMSLSSSGRQRDIEVGYARALSDTATWRLNLMHSLEPGHDKDASSDTSAVLSFQRAF